MYRLLCASIVYLLFLYQEIMKKMEGWEDENKIYLKYYKSQILEIQVVLKKNNYGKNQCKMQCLNLT